jgi:hypothetical protein
MEDEQGNPIGTTHISSANITINSIKIEFGNRVENGFGAKIFWGRIGRGQEPSECDYEVEICALNLTDLAVTTPWGESFRANDYLPPGWQGEDFERDCVLGPDVDLDVEAGTDDESGGREIAFDWDFECGGDKWNSLETGNTQLTVYYSNGTTWSGTLDFSSSPMPTQTPNITAPADGATNVSLLPEFTWDQWENPGTANPGIWWELENDFDDEIEEEHAPADTATWTPPARLTPNTGYKFYVDFHHCPVVQVNGVDFVVNSYLESSISFTTEDSDVTPISGGNSQAYPANPLEPVDMPTAVDPAANPVTVGACPDITIRPTLQVPAADVGQTATMIMYIYVPAAGFGINIPPRQTTLTAVTECDLIPTALDFSDAVGFSFYVYYGYVLGSTIRYNAYAVTVGDTCSAIPDCAAITDISQCNATDGCTWQAFPNNACVLDCLSFETESACNEAFDGNSCTWVTTAFGSSCQLK